jgi:AcrR family transcriptional regulator
MGASEIRNSKKAAGKRATKVSLLRREQIVEAAAAIIAEQGLQNLSLSEIEKKAGMSRGQLTYYFPAKEDILLAVFDHHLELMYRRIGTPPSQANGEPSGWEWIQHLFHRLLSRPLVSADFYVLQYTFLSQLGHRQDFRRRLASLYAEWRENITRGLSEDWQRKGSRPDNVSAEMAAAVVQALLHGLAMQTFADPQAFDRKQMASHCLGLLAAYLDAGKPAESNGAKEA